MNRVRILVGDVFGRLAQLPDESVHCVVTSPPYWGLRAYGGEEKMIGLEPTFEEHLDVLVRVFREVRRVLRPDGTLWLNYGDAYSGGGRGPAGGPMQNTNLGSLDGSLRSFSSCSVTGLAAKQLLMMPARVALALQADGWWLRSEIVWAKKNPMPESVMDRPTSAHEKLYLLTKQKRYFYDSFAVRFPPTGGAHARRKDGETKPAKGSDTSDRRPGTWKEKPDKQRGHSRRHQGFNDRWDAMPRVRQQAMGANLRNVLNLATEGFPAAHFAVMPTRLVEPCIKAGTSEKGCCAVCGAPFERIVRKNHRNPGNRTTNGPRSVERSDETAGFNRRLEAVHSSAGWQLSACDAGDPVPAVVLDPFAGAGTVGLVARRLGRAAILIELNVEFAALSLRRIEAEAPLLASVQIEDGPQESHETSQLLAG